MNIKELTSSVNKAIHAKYGVVLPNYKLEYGIRQLFEIIKEATASGETVNVSDFGRFVAIDVKERIVENHLTAKVPEGKVVVPAHKVPKFRAADAYKSLLQYGKQEVETEEAV